MSKYRFNKKTGNAVVDDLFRQIEDNLATLDDVDSRLIKTTALLTSAPKANSMGDGDEKMYDDGSNVYLYRRAGGRLFKVQMTEV